MREPERALQQPLPRGAGQEIVSTHDFGHALCRVVDHHRELIRGHAVATSDQKIADLGLDVKGSSAAQLVLEVGNALGHEQANAGAASARALRVGEPRVAPSTSAAIARLADAELRRAQAFSQVLAGAGAGVGEPSFEQLVRGSGESFQTCLLYTSPSPRD